MTKRDRIRNEAEKAGGKVKEAAGRVTDDESLEAEGRLDQAKADAKNAGENLKEAARDAKDALSD